jgi:hypothetical protein
MEFFFPKKIIAAAAHRNDEIPPLYSVLVQIRHLNDVIAIAQTGPPIVVASDEEKGISRLVLFCDAPPGPPI